MYSTTKNTGSPVHPALLAFSLALYAAALVCFICFDSYHDSLWFRLAISANALGVVLTLAAIIPALVDMVLNPGEGGGRTFFGPVIFNLISMVLFVVNLYLYVSGWNLKMPPANYAVALTGVGVICTVVSFVYGWKLVHVSYREMELDIHHEGWELGN